ncbi:MAG: choice-of-anchor Q domain-containing protein [Verrucomicrobiota bacterium]
MKQTIIIVSLILFSGICPKGFATSYYCDPVGGSMGNTGTSTNSAWGNLQSVFLAGKTFSAADEIFLMNGAHGQPDIGSAGTHTDYVTIKPYPGHTPKVASLRIRAGSYWALDNLTFATDGSGGTFTRSYMLETLVPIDYIKAENCSFYSVEDSSAWSKTDWDANADKAVMIRGDYTIFNTNTIENTSFALEIRGNHAEVKGNLIDNFSGDALRALGSDATYEGNTIRDAYIHDYAVNHDDAIQMYTLFPGTSTVDPNGVISNVVFRNNKIYNFADPITPQMIAQNMVGYWMQSIINTDGHVENVVIENNLIVADHSHGITLLGPVNCRVQNNTVMKTPTEANQDSGNNTPWIAFWADKVGNQPADSTMRNNISSLFTPGTHSAGSNILVENNLEPAASTYTNVFADYNNFDFSLKTGSPAFNAGANTDLTATDIASKPRWVGTYVDCGAYEFQPYEAWIAGYPGVGAETNMTDNPDNDSLNNLWEWALGGNPDDDTDIGHSQTVGIIEYMGDNWLEYIHAKHNDADALGLSYYVEKNTQLTNSAAWTINYDFMAGEPDSAGSGFGTVTNWVITTVEDAQFMRLIIEAD